jgi:hypothetical protein
MPCTDAEHGASHEVRPFDPTDLIDLLVYVHAAVDEIQIAATGLVHVTRGTGAEASAGFVACTLDAIHAKILSRLEALEAELERRGV